MTSCARPQREHLLAVFQVNEPCASSTWVPSSGYITATTTHKHSKVKWKKKRREETGGGKKTKQKIKKGKEDKGKGRRKVGERSKHETLLTLSLQIKYITFLRFKGFVQSCEHEERVSILRIHF